MFLRRRGGTPWLAGTLPVRGRRAAVATAVLLVGLAVMRGVLCARPGSAWQGKARDESPLPQGVLAALDDGLARVAVLGEKVDAGQIIPRFGEEAQKIMSEAATRAGSPVPELQASLDGALHALFLRQVGLLKQRAVLQAQGLGHRSGALEEAGRHFSEEVALLVRPGSGWSFQPQLQSLRAELESSLRRSAALTEERARAARLQQATIGVIQKLQEQMEQLQQKVQAGVRGGGSPWIFSTSYRLPNTPLQLAGRYEQGRANIELSLTPDKPTDSDAGGFIDGIGPANLGISFNLGL